MNNDNLNLANFIVNTFNLEVNIKILETNKVRNEQSARMEKLLEQIVELLSGPPKNSPDIV